VIVQHLLFLQVAQPDRTHTYSNSGSYEITITGSLFGFNFNNGGDKAKLTDVKKWSALEINNGTSNFLGCSNLTGVATDAPFISTTSFAKLFQACTNFNGEIGNWDISNVTSMGDMFDGATNFNADLSNWDVSNITNTSVMFRGSAFDNGGSSGINNWNTSKFQNLDSMFNNAQAFNQDIGNWNMSSATVLTNFMANKNNYQHLDSIYNNWPNYKLKPNITANFGGNKYTTNGAAGRALLTGSYASASIQTFNPSSSGGTDYYTIQVDKPHTLSVGSRFTLTGSDNAVLNKAHTVTSVIGLDTIGIEVPYTASTPIGAFIYTGYGWNVADGGQL
jgi:surface protein